MNERKLHGIGEFPRRGISLVVRIADELDLHEIPAERAHAIYLLARRIARHEYHSPHLELRASESDSLRMIASGSADDALSLFRWRQDAHAIVRAAQFIGAHHLQILALQIDLRAKLLRKSAVELKRRLSDDAAKSISRLIHQIYIECSRHNYLSEATQDISTRAFFGSSETPTVARAGF